MAPVDTEALYNHLHGEMYSFLLSRVGSEAAAEDILQSAFLRAHESLSTGDAPENPRAWLYRIVRNLVVDAHRHALRQRALRDVVAREPVSDPDAHVLDSEAFAMVARALPVFIDALDPLYRDALTMTELEGLTMAEAAERAGISLSGMKSRVQRGRGRVFEALERCCELELDARGHLMGCTRRASCEQCC